MLGIKKDQCIHATKTLEILFIATKVGRPRAYHVDSVHRSMYSSLEILALYRTLDEYTTLIIIYCTFHIILPSSSAKPFYFYTRHSHLCTAKPTAIILYDTAFPPLPQCLLCLLLVCLHHALHLLHTRYLKVQTGRLAWSNLVAQVSSMRWVSVILDVGTARRVGQSVSEWAFSRLC